MFERDESAIYQYRSSGCAQGRDDLVAVGVTVAAVAHHELVVSVEGAARLDPLPLISVGDRMSERPARTAEAASARWQPSSRCVPCVAPIDQAATRPG